MESKFEVKTFIVKYFCQPCARKGGAEYKYTGRTMLTSPVKYEHRCEKCNERKMLPKQYPVTEYEYIINGG